MSFILDALKRSETERQRRSTPGIADLPDGSGDRGAPRWLWVLVALLALNAAILGALWLKPAGDPGTGAAAPEAAAAAASPEPAAPDPAPFSRLVSEAREALPPAAVAEPDTDTTPAAGSREVAANERPAGEPAARPASPPPASATLLPTFNELRARGVLALPDLHLDIHVYSDKPGDRFVFVNMNKYREQGTLDEGPVVREIREDGVVLEHQGTEFLLPRE